MAAISRDWSDLPSELVEEIILKIDFLEDVLRFSRVCRAWFKAFVRIRPLWTPASPWLLLSENTHDNPECVRKAYDTGNDKYYHLKLPQTFGRNCWGSEFGWIVTFGLDFEINLFNPITKLELCLPSFDTLTSVQYGCNGDCKYYRKLMRHFHIYKARVFKAGKALHFYSDGVDEDEYDDGNDDGLFVVLVYFYDGPDDYPDDYPDDDIIARLAIARPGDTRWTLIESPFFHMRDVLFWKDLLWICGSNFKLWYVDLHKGGPSFKAMEFVLDPQTLVNDHTIRDRVPQTYMVNGIDHQLFLILRLGKSGKNKIDYDDDDGNNCVIHYNPEIFWNSQSVFTDSFLIYKLDFSRKMWKQVDSSELDAVSIFLGKNTSLVSKGGTSKSKYIYFSGDFLYKCGHDIGIYNLDSSKVERVYDGDDANISFCSPFWFTPLLY